MKLSEGEFRTFIPTVATSLPGVDLKPLHLHFIYMTFIFTVDYCWPSLCSPIPLDTIGPKNTLAKEIETPRSPGFELVCQLTFDNNLVRVTFTVARPSPGTPIPPLLTSSGFGRQHLSPMSLVPCHLYSDSSPAPTSTSTLHLHPPPPRGTNCLCRPCSCL